MWDVAHQTLFKNLTAHPPVYSVRIMQNNISIFSLFDIYNFGWDQSIFLGGRIRCFMLRRSRENTCSGGSSPVTCSDGGQTNVVGASLLRFIREALHQAESCQHREERRVRFCFSHYTSLKAACKVSAHCVFTRSISRLKTNRRCGNKLIQISGTELQYNPCVGLNWCKFPNKSI